MGKKNILDVRVKEVEKRRHPTKHYVYVLEVSWSEGSSITVYRRYSDFFEFQCLLLEKFPVEGGVKDPSQRMIPFLPGKKLLGRSNIRTVAEKRKEKIDEYCRALIRLPPNISDSIFVQEFFEIRQTDLEKPKKVKPVKGQPKINEISDPLILERYVAIADYEKQKKNECSLVAGQTVEVIDKNENGWWFVNVDDFHEGWVPATYLEPLYGTEDMAVQKLDIGEEETWIAMNRYEAQHHDELSFEKGVLLEVFEKGIDGWWKVRYQDKEGMAPAAYLRRYHGSGAGQASTGAEIVGTLKDATLDQSLVQSTSSSTSPASSKPLKTLSTANGVRSPTITSSTSASQPFSSSLNTTSPTSLTSPTRISPTPKSPPGDSSRSATHTAPTPSPKPVNAAAVAAAAIADKQKFAPTWHSKAKTHVDEEPIYAPTPRRYSFKKPPLKKKDPSRVSDLEPVYDIIPQPEAEVYMTIAEFTATAGDSINFQAGMVCTIVTKNANGWWYVDMDGKEGWVPSSYLEKVSGDSPSSTKKSSTSQPSQSKPKSEPKVAVLKTEPVKEVSRRANPAPPPTQSRKTFSNGISGTERKSSLRRSTSTDSGLNEDVDGTKNKPKVVPLRSPPANRANAAPARPSRPKATPAIPNGPKSPRPGGGRSTLKPTISGPMTVHVSPAARRKSEAATTIKAGASARPTPPVTSSDRGTRTSPAVKRPPPKQRSSEDVPSVSNTSTTHKKQSAPEVSVTSLRGGDSSSDRRQSASSRPSHVRRGSDSGPSGSNLKSELEKRLFPKPASQVSASGPSSQPKRPSPPNRPRAPSTKTSPGAPQRPSTGPSRPQPPKVGPAKRPPPPMAKSAVSFNKRTSYVTVGSYSAAGGDSCLSFDEGVEVEVIEKNNDGWWFVNIKNKEGWAPSTYIEEKKPGAVSPGPSRPPSRPKPVVKPSPVESEPQDDDTSVPRPRPRPRPRKATATFYRATDSYDGEDDGELQLVQGRVYELREKSDSGWWLMKDGDIEGWAPSNYLQKV